MFCLKKSILIFICGPEADPCLDPTGRQWHSITFPSQPVDVRHKVRELRLVRETEQPAEPRELFVEIAITGQTSADDESGGNRRDEVHDPGDGVPYSDESSRAKQLQRRQGGRRHRRGGNGRDGCCSDRQSFSAHENIGRQIYFPTH